MKNCWYSWLGFVKDCSYSNVINVEPAFHCTQTCHIEFRSKSPQSSWNSSAISSNSQDSNYTDDCQKGQFLPIEISSSHPDHLLDDSSFTLTSIPGPNAISPSNSSIPTRENWPSLKDKQISSSAKRPICSPTLQIYPDPCLVPFQTIHVIKLYQWNHCATG